MFNSLVLLSKTVLWMTPGWKKLILFINTFQYTAKISTVFFFFTEIQFSEIQKFVSPKALHSSRSGRQA